MNKGQSVEIIDLLEDMIGELSGSYVTGTGKDGIPKRLFQVNDYLNGKSTDAKECIFSPAQLKVIAGDKKAKEIAVKALNVYNQRIELSKELQSRIYGCYSQKIPVNGDIERANFEIEAYERLNNLNQEHFNHMSEQGCCKIDDYMTIIENHVNGLNTVYLKELEDSIGVFCENHNAETVIKPELIGKYFGSMESNRIGSNIRKQEAVNPVYKEYGSFLDKMDKSTIAAQNKEFVPQKILGYKLQYLITKTKIVDAINIYYCVVRLRMKIVFSHLPWKLLKSIFGFSIFIALNQIIDQINWQTDKVILGKMINGAAVAIYVVGASINTMYISFSTAISSVFTPQIHRIVNSNLSESEQNEKLTNLFVCVGRIQFFVLALILSGFVFFGEYFIYRWAGVDYGESYYIALLLICPVTIPLIQNIGIEIQRAKNKHQFRSIVYLIMALLNVGISIWLCYLLGIIGVAIGTTISLLVANGIIINIYYQKKLGINIIKFWKSILSTLPAFVIPIACGIVIMLFYNFKSLLDFGLFIIIYVIIYAVSIYFLGLNREEKNIIFGRFKRVKQK